MPKFRNENNAADIFELKHEHAGYFYDSTPVSDDGRADPFNSLDPINGLDAFNSASGPAAPAIASFSPDTGVLDDGITNANVLTLAGTAPASSTVNVYDGVSLLDMVTVDGNGAWSCTTGTLSNGPHSSTATDTVSGTTSSASSALNVTIHTTAPTGGTPGLVAGLGSGRWTTDNLTNVTSPSFTVALNPTVAARDTAHDVTHTITPADVDPFDGPAPILLNASSGTTGTTQTASSSDGSSFTTTSAQSTGWLNVTFDQSVNSAPSGFVSAVNYVVSYFDSLFTTTATININVGYGEVNGTAMPGGYLGESETNYFGETYNAVKSALLAQNAPGASTLPTTSPAAGTLYLGSAEAKSLGLYSSTTSTDGYVGLSSSVSWDYTTATPSAGQYNFIGTLEHEITEALGRVSLVNYQPYFYSLMDLFRYSSPGVRSLTPGGSGSTAYFSVDNGTTNLATWNNNPSNGDLGDWYPANGNDAANDYGSAGVINAFSATDITNMQALGFALASSGPAAPTITSFSPDSGTVADGITNATVLTLTGTDAANSTVNVYDGATLLGTAVANASGAWSFTTGTLSNGSHSFTATDAVSGTTSAAVTATVDTVAPTETISGTIGTNTGSTTTIASGGLTHDNTLALSGTVSDTNGVSSVHVFDGATDLGAATIVAGTWSLTTTALSNGTHSFTARATDNADNITTTAAVTATVDTTAPSETISSTIGTDTGLTTTISSGGLTHDNTLALSGTVSDTNGVSSVHVFDGATDLGAATIVAGTWSLTTTALSNGTHSFTARATDNAGNITTTAAVTATVDTTAPSAPVFVTDAIVNTNEVMFTGTAEANSTVKVYDGATLLNSVTADGTGAWTYTTAALTNGSHRFTGTDTDTAGNTSQASQPVDSVIGSVVIESAGSTSLTEIGSHYYLYNSSGSGPSLKLSGTDVVDGQLAPWTPIGAEQTASGYEVAWKVTGADQYTVWNIANNGNAISDTIGTVSGTSAALQSLEASFHQDLNGDGVIGSPSATVIGSVVIESAGSTSLTEIGSHYYLYNSSGSGPSLKLSGTDVVDGQLAPWTPIGAEQTASGYEVAWKVTGADQYTVWNIANNGNAISDTIGTVSGTSAALQSLEASFHQDLNGDGVIGSPSATVIGSVVIELAGSTSLTEVANNYFLYAVGGSLGPELKFCRREHYGW